MEVSRPWNEKLLGRGDALYLPTDAAKPRRLQGVFVSDEEVEQLVAFWTQDRFTNVEREVFDELLDEAQAQIRRICGWQPRFSANRR